MFSPLRAEWGQNIWLRGFEVCSRTLPTHAFMHLGHNVVMGEFSSMVMSAYCGLLVSCEGGWEDKGGEGGGEIL